VKSSLFALALALTISCGGTTGGGRVSFTAAAAGPASASGGTVQFTNSQGYHVVLTRARLHIGSVFLNQSVPASGSQGTACVLPGIYVAEVLGSLDVNALLATPQPFAVTGDANAVRAQVAEIWLSGGDVNTIDDSTVILDTAGTADKGGIQYPFQAALTIGRNRYIASTDPAFPSANPICKQRIVSPIPVDLTPQDGGTLLIRIDPSAWFRTVDFSKVPKVSDSPLLYRFSDSAAGEAEVSLYNGLRSRLGVYQFIWQ
jgi:hypothetical protein